ncbi:hypothetical protein C1645_775542 [Glomus cerebriforme]|uniref:Uncharacterized protein n=1 Tax=Glomus cerebriforme TaxID=658196 RepID=A0A397STH8_9GLOM|nr:hypothetical protein C1645_775542 [Glomus cerebriforme]
MCDPAGSQPPQRVEKASYDTINVKLKSEIIVRIDQVPLQDSAKVQKAEDTIEKELQMTSSTDNQEEVDLMNFDDNWSDFDNNNDPIREVAHNAQQHVSMIDQLLCDLNFGRDKDESKVIKSNNVQENKMTQNEQTTSKPPEQETPKKKVDDKMRTNNDVFMFQVPPVSSLVSTKMPSDPSYFKPTNGTKPAVTSYTCVTNTTQTGPSHVKPVNEMQPTVIPRTRITKKTQTDITFPVETAVQKQNCKPRRRKIYSFVELLIYQFSPITKELHNDVGGRFSQYVVDYDLLNENPQVSNNQPRYPGVLRGSIQQQRNGWNNKGFDSRDRSMNCKDRFVTSQSRRHFESPLELSFLKECVIAQNRWTALLREKELRTSYMKEVKDCKDMKWINLHMNLTDKHSESCLVHKVINGQNKAVKEE